MRDAVGASLATAPSIFPENLSPLLLGCSKPAPVPIFLYTLGKWSVGFCGTAPYATSSSLSSSPFRAPILRGAG